MSADLVIKGGMELIGGLIKWSESNKVRTSNKERDAVAKALRAIYFTPTGPIRLIEQIVKGEKPRAKERQQILTQFNDVEWRVARALRTLEFDERFGSLSVSLSTARQLRDLANGKVSIRRAIQETLNHYGQPNRKINRQKLKRLLSDIKKLNAKIEKLEAIINVRAR